MIELRWLVKANPVTAEDVIAERERTGEGMRVCLDRLKKQSGPVLQFRYASPMRQTEWKDVPTVVEPHHEPK